MSRNVLRSLATLVVAFTFAAPAMAAVPTLAPVVEMVQPSVVAIEVEPAALPAAREGRRSLPRNGPSGPDSFFEREFGKHLPWPPGMPAIPDQSLRRHGGSGFFIDTEGHLVTNAHLIGEDREIRVHTADGDILEAEVIGQDRHSDIAVLKVELDRPVPHATFADSDAVRVGDWVFAIGSPYGFRGTVTTGIVSARGRDIGAGQYGDFLQIDAPINRGNSGGPTFDLEGRVVGVNTAIYSPTGGSVGIGFAVPSNTVRLIVADLMDDGKVERGWLGVQIQPLDRDLSEALGLDEPHGALIADVSEGSPAAAAGLEPGGVVTAVDHARVEGARDLARLVGLTSPGEEVTLTVWRDRREHSITVRLGGWPGSDPAAPPGSTGSHLGLQFGQDGGAGAVIEEVEPASPAAVKNLLPGDRILKVDGVPVSDSADASQRLAAAWNAKQQFVVLEVARGPEVRFVALRLRHA